MSPRAPSSSLEPAGERSAVRSAIPDYHADHAGASALEEITRRLDGLTVAMVCGLLDVLWTWTVWRLTGLPPSGPHDAR